MRKKFSLLCLLAASTFLAAPAHSQEAASARVLERVTRDGSPSLITFRPDGERYSLANAATALKEQLGLTDNDRLVLVKTEKDDLGFVHQKYEQYYRGVKVEYVSYTVHAKGGFIESLSGRFVPIHSLTTTPAITAAKASANALVKAGIRKNTLLEGTGKSPGELLILGPGIGTLTQPVLVWKITVRNSERRIYEWVYVNAQTGEIVTQEPIMLDAGATGTFDTAYSGTLSLADETAPGGGYRMRDYTRGSGIEVYNAHSHLDEDDGSYNGVIPGLTDFTDNDNNWTAAEYQNASFDNAAGDALLGAQVTYDYWSKVHGRNSYDNTGALLKNYVHYGNRYENAFWDRTYHTMAYGDGNTTFKPLTSLDVCGHEIGHGICQYTANLAYLQESGALNEGLSDIWGACIEAYGIQSSGVPSANKSTWLIGEQIFNNGPALRSMSDPRSTGQPAYYNGQNWVPTNSSSDYGGVHTNSGVLNFWFYLLTQGGSGTNEGGTAYCVNGLGLDYTQKIVYRMESVYLSSSSTYADARTYSLQATADLYGTRSQAYATVADAWNAVGIGAKGVYAITGPAYICNGTDATFTGSQASSTVWTVSPSSMFTVTSGYGGTFTTSGVAGASGTGTITAQFINSGCNIKTATYTVTFAQSTGRGLTIVAYYTRVGTSNQVAITNGSNPAVPAGTYNIDVSSLNTQSYSPAPATFAPWVFGDYGAAGAYNSNTNHRGTIVVGKSGGCSINISATDGCYNPTFYCRISSAGYRSSSPAFQVSPNPAREMLTIEANPPSSQEADPEAVTDMAAAVAPFTARLYNSFGILVKTQESQQGKVQLNTLDVPNGLYILRVGEGINAKTEQIEVAH